MADNNGKVDTTSTVKATESGMRRRIYHPAFTPEGKLQAADAAVRIVDQQFFMLIYDIPTVFNDDVPNPSALLWHFGFRLNLSCWVLPEGSMKTSTVKNLRDYWDAQETRFEPVKGRLKAQRVRHYVIPYAESARADIMAIAREKLAEEINRANESLHERMNAAETRYKEAKKKVEASAAKYGRRVTATEADGLQYTRILGCQSALRTASEALDACMRCVCLFEMGECQEVAHLVEALRHGIVANQATLKALKEVSI